MFDKYADKKEQVKLSGDTIVQHVHQSIPLFRISKDNVLKTFKGYCFLNVRTGEFNWTQTILSVEKGIMKVRTIFDISRDDLPGLEPVQPDSTSFEMDVIKKPLKKVLIETGFGKSAYIRLAKNGR